MSDPRHFRLPKRALATLTQLGDYAIDDDCNPDNYMKESTIVHDADTGAVVLVYIAPIEESTIVLLDKLRHMEITPKSRMKKIRGKKVVTPWDVLGYRPRNEYRQHYNCAPADLATEHLDADLVLKAFGKVVTRYYRQYGDAVYTYNAERIELVRPEWRIEETPFTSGIVNKDGLLPYHLDKTNFDDVWSGMVAFRHNMDGGHLSVPEYDVGFKIADRSLLLFDGQSLLHGVTPMRSTGRLYRPACSRSTIWA